MTGAHPAYRPDIDGLRAVAVLAVLAYHVGFAWAPGGYVGVDVFFVISGYLIGGIVEREVASGSFSIGLFYARRACRILPAFLAVCAATSALSWAYLFPQDLTAYARSLVAASLSVSNLYFVAQAGYFDASASTQPLIHTWSLAVEEQFYVLLPLYALLARCRFPRFGRAGLMALLAASLGVSSVLAFPAPDSCFYLLHSRAWELLLGAVLAFPHRFRPGRVAREALAAGGAALILAAILAFSAATPFPGGAALLPCLGAAAIIAAGEAGPTLVSWGLGRAPMLFVGRISYSLYLWHWPIVVFQHQYAFLVPNQAFAASDHPYLLRNAAVVAASFLCATASWRWIEQPFRHGYRHLRTGKVLAWGGAGLAALAGIGGLALGAGGFEGRFSPEANRWAAYLGHDQRAFREGSCFIVPPYRAGDFDAADCLAQRDGRKAYLLLGDSHAAHLWYGLARTLGDADVLQATAAGCRPVLDQPFGANRECARVIGDAFRDIAGGRKLSAVILAGRWSQADLPPLARTLDWLRARGVAAVVIGPMVEYTSALPRLLALASERGDPGLPGRALVPLAALDARVAAVAAQAGARYVSLHLLLCGAGDCPTVLPGGVPLEFDGDHFTLEGSVFAARRLVEDRALP